jgi:hypothetical protein
MVRETAGERGEGDGGSDGQKGGKDVGDVEGEGGPEGDEGVLNRCGVKKSLEAADGDGGSEIGW